MIAADGLAREAIETWNGLMINETLHTGDRQDRCDPRAIKRRPKPYRLLMIPREEAKRRIEQGEIIYERIKH